MPLIHILRQAIFILAWQPLCARGRSITIAKASAEQTPATAVEETDLKNPGQRHVGTKKVAESSAQDDRVTVEGIKDDELTCSCCLWSGKALRAALAERMPGRVKNADRRAALAREVLEATEEPSVCHRHRFPKHFNQKQVYATKRIYFADKDAPRDDYSRYREVTSGMDVAVKQITDTCEAVVDSLSNRIVERIKASKGRHLSEAVSDRWLCYRATDLCPHDDVPEADADEEENDEL